MESQIDEITRRIYSDAENIVVQELQGVRSRNSFDLFKVDYMIDRDSLPYRIENIVNRIVALVYPHVESVVKKQRIEAVKRDIRKMLNECR